MNDHRRFRALAAQAIDFELTAAEQAALDAHLASCDACRASARGFRGDALQLADMPRMLPLAGMRFRFETVWLPRAERPRTAGIRPLLAVAAVMLLGAATILGAAGRLGLVPTPVPTEPAHTAAPPAGMGEVTIVQLAAGPGAHDGTCAIDVDTGCATDILAALDAVWATTTDRIVRLHPSDGRPTGEIEVGGHPIRMASDGRSLWVSVRGPGAIVRIDPASNSVEARFELPGLPAGIAFGHGSLWVVMEDADRLLRVAPSDGEVLATIDVGDAPWEVAATGDAVWLTNRFGEALVHVDPAIDDVRTTWPVPGGKPSNFWGWGDGVVVDDGVIYVAASNASARFDPVTGRFTSTAAPNYSHLATAGGRLWRVAGSDGLVVELDPLSFDVIASLQLSMQVTSVGGEWETSIDASDEAIWLRSYTTDRVVRIAH